MTKGGKSTSLLALLGGEKVVTLELPPEWPIYNEKDAKAVTKLALQGKTFDYYRGAVIAGFEDDFAAYHNVDHALVVNSGTSALHSAFFGVGIGAGDEVLCPTYTFITTVTPLFLLNAIPVLCEAKASTGNIDPNDVERRITKRTKAIVVTHMWGHPADMDEIMALSSNHDLVVIEDCSHAHGATYKGKKVGTFGDVAAFSLGGGKMISGGMAGIMITNDQKIYDRACLLGHFRQRCRETVKTDFYKQFWITGFGCNYRGSPLSVVLAHHHLRKLDEMIKIKRENLEHLTAGLKGIKGIGTPYTEPFVTRGAWYGYKLSYRPEELRGLSKELFIEALIAEGVAVKQPRSAPLHTLPLFQTTDNHLYHYNTGCDYGGRNRIVYKNGDFPISEDIYSRSLSLPAKNFNVPAKDIINQYVIAFRKVSKHYKDLLKMKHSR